MQGRRGRQRSVRAPGEHPTAINQQAPSAVTGEAARNNRPVNVSMRAARAPAARQSILGPKSTSMVVSSSPKPRQALLWPRGTAIVSDDGSAFTPRVSRTPTPSCPGAFQSAKDTVPDVFLTSGAGQIQPYRTPQHWFFCRARRTQLSHLTDLRRPAATRPEPRSREAVAVLLILVIGWSQGRGERTRPCSVLVGTWPNRTEWAAWPSAAGNLHRPRTARRGGRATKARPGGSFQARLAGWSAISRFAETSRDGPAFCSASCTMPGVKSTGSTMTSFGFPAG